MNENKDRNVIYQYVYHNYDNEFHMMGELKRMMNDYYAEILSGEYFYDFEKFDSFSDGDLILKDIIPPIMKYEVIDMNLSHFKNENDLCRFAYKMLTHHINKLKTEIVEHTVVLRFIHKLEND